MRPTGNKAEKANNDTATGKSIKYDIDAIRSLLLNLQELQGWQSGVISECSRQLEELATTEKM